MKQFDNERIVTDPDTLAAAVVEVALSLSRMVRTEVHHRRPADLSLTQVRALALLGRNAGVSLSDAAERLGIGVPTMSKLVDDLVERGLVRREVAVEDRRRLTLDITDAGEASLAEAMAVANARVLEVLEPLSAADRARVGEAAALLMPLVRSVGGACPPEEDADG